MVWKRESLRDLYLGTAVVGDEFVDVVGEGPVSVESLTDRPLGVDGLHDVHVGGGRCRGRRWVCRANHGGGGRSAPTIRHNMAGADEQHQHDRRQDEKCHQPPAGVDLPGSGGFAEPAGNDNCDGHDLPLSLFASLVEVLRKT